MQPTISRSVGGGEVATLRHAIKTGETLSNGDFVVLEADGTVSEATAASAALYGRAYLDYESGYALVEPAVATEYLVHADGAITIADVGHYHAMSVDGTTGEHMLDQDATGTTDIFTIREVVDSTLKLCFVAVTTGKVQGVQEV